MSKHSTSKTRRSRESQTDYKRIDAVGDKDIDYSDIPPVTAEQFAKGILRKDLKPAPGKKQITLRIDEDVLDWFRRRGRGYQTQINDLLREYMKAHNTSRPPRK